MKIANVTQHTATQEQIEAGVVELDELDAIAIRSALTFDELPTYDTLRVRAAVIAHIVQMRGFHCAMIGGAPYLMSHLEDALEKREVVPMYSFSERVSIEVHRPDGTVTKTNVFKHKGFVS